MPLDEELIALGREIHRRPELAGEERETAGLIAEQLRAAGLEVTTGVGGHGVVAVLDGSADGPTVAYRADMDAVDATRNVLPFPRSGRVHDEGFASRVPDVAHQCGYDLHPVIGVGVASWPSRLRGLRAVPGRGSRRAVPPRRANPDAGIDGAPHSPDLAADERAIGLGVRAMTGLPAHRLAALERTDRSSPGRREGADRP